MFNEDWSTTDMYATFLNKEANSSEEIELIEKLKSEFNLNEDEAEVIYTNWKNNAEK